MKLLIDTHIFLWLAQGSNQLPANTLSALYHPEHQRFLSLVSLWEMQIKYSTGKLALPMSVQQFFLAQRRLLKLQLVTVSQQHIWTLGTLPMHHRDPFDRMLIAQAIEENFTLVSADAIFTQYSVALLGRSAPSEGTVDDAAPPAQPPAPAQGED